RQERASNKGAPAFPLRHLFPGHFPEVPQTEHLDEVFGACDRFLIRPPSQHQLGGSGGPGVDHLAGGQRGTKRMAWVDVADRLPQLPDIHASELVPQYVHTALGGMVHRAAHAEDRALARAVRADEGPPLPRLHAEVDIGEDVPAIPDEADALESSDLPRGPRVHLISSVSPPRLAASTGTRYNIPGTRRYAVSWVRSFGRSSASRDGTCPTREAAAAQLSACPTGRPYGSRETSSASGARGPV